MANKKFLSIVLCSCVILSTFPARAADSENAELRRELDELRKTVGVLQQAATPISNTVDAALDSKYGPDAAVTTKSGKLTIGGLLHVWYYNIEKDSRGLFSGAGPAGLADTNEGQDNSSFRIRRAELSFSMDIHENISTFVLIDPTAEIGSFPLITDNQGLHKRANQVSPEFNAANGPGLGDTGNINAVRNGAGGTPVLLEDCFMNFHGIIPHHDVTIGQFKPQIGEESIRSSAQLDFVERSFTGLANDAWDLGVAIHGTWWCDRFQYTLGIMNGAGNYHGSAGQTYNRSDDNDQKDFTYRVLVRPLWSDCFGHLELGASGKFGRHGESGNDDPVNAPVLGLNRPKSWAMFHDFWGSYEAGGAVKGLWVKGEYAWIKDRNAPGTVADDSGNGVTDIGNTGSGSGLGQGTGRSFSTQGFYVAAGYNIGNSSWAHCAPCWLKNFEFAGRYDCFQNVAIANLVDPSKTDAYRTHVYTGAVNYYIKGQNAKIQLNYNAVRDPSGGSGHHFHQVRNDSLVINFQVAF